MLVALNKLPSPREKSRDILRRDMSRLPWAWEGLCFGAPVQEASNEGLRDVVNNVAVSAASGTAWTNDTRGNPALNMSATATVTYPDNAQHDKPVSAITAYVRLRASGTPDVGGGIFGHSNTGSAQTMTWGLQYAAAAGNKVAAVIGANVTTTTLEGTQALSTTDFSNVFLRWVTGDKLYLDVYNDFGGLLLQQSSASTVGGTLPYTAGQGVVLNRTDSATTNWSGHYSQALIWNRRLSDGQCARLSADPFGWYSPKRETLIFGSTYVTIAPDPGMVHAAAGFTNWA